MFWAMPWLCTDAMEQKMAFIRQAQCLPKGGFAVLCRQFGIARKTGYKWRRRFAQDNRLRALQDRSRRPRRSPRRIAGALEERILELRQPDGWGARKIAHLLWEEGVRVSVATVHRTLLRHGRVHPLDRHAPALTRFERPAPNDLFQADFKGPMGRAGARDEPGGVLGARRGAAEDPRPGGGEQDPPQGRGCGPGGGVPKRAVPPRGRAPR